MNSEAGDVVGQRQLLGSSLPDVYYQITLFSHSGDFGDAVDIDGVRCGFVVFFPSLRLLDGVSCAVAASAF